MLFILIWLHISYRVVSSSSPASPVCSHYIDKPTNKCFTKTCWFICNATSWCDQAYSVNYFPQVQTCNSCRAHAPQFSPSRAYLHLLPFLHWLIYNNPACTINFTFSLNTAVDHKFESFQRHWAWNGTQLASAKWVNNKSIINGW